MNDKASKTPCNKLELGCGQRPTPGYLHQDITRQPGVTLDFHCPIWEVPLKENSLSEIVAVGLMEHLRFAEIYQAMKHIHELLAPGGEFLLMSRILKHGANTLSHYARFAGEESVCQRTRLRHVLGLAEMVGRRTQMRLVEEDLVRHLGEIGFSQVIEEDYRIFLSRGITRDRFKNPADAHLYIRAVK
jgi:predicted SAM-dependent methyltransferase